MAVYWAKAIKRLVASEEGPTTVEYAVLLALIIGVCIASVQTMSNATRSSFDASSNAIGNAMGS